MRIISGSHKGRKIIAPATLPARPTTDFAKEALFNILNNRFDVEGLSVLDLFSGTGNIAYEFASRGAQQITAIEKDAKSATFIQKTATELELPIQTIRTDVFRFLEHTEASYHIIFADPPYAMDTDSLLRLIEIIYHRKLLQPDGLCIIEHSSKLNLSGFAHYESTRKYGGSSFSFFESFN